MSATTLTEKAVLKMPLKWGDRVLRVQEIQGKMTNNTYFPDLWTATALTQTQFNADITAFINSETAVNAYTPGAVGLRNAAWKTIKQDLSYMLIMVQAKADANPNIGATIIVNASFFVRTTPSDYIPKH